MPYGLPRIRGLVAPAGLPLIAMPLFFAPARPVQQHVYLPLLTVSRRIAPTSTPTWTPTRTPTRRPTRTPTRTPTPTRRPVCGCWSNLYKCSDFATQSAAQQCFDYCWQQVGFDVHRLDGDDDGEACESLP